MTRLRPQLSEHAPIFGGVAAFVLLLLLTPAGAAMMAPALVVLLVFAGGNSGERLVATVRRALRRPRRRALPLPGAAPRPRARAATGRIVGHGRWARPPPAAVLG